MKIKEKIFIILSFVAFIQPNFFVKINILNKLSIMFAVLCLFILVLKTVRKDVKIDSTLFLIILWRIFILIPTIYRNGEIIKWGYQSVVFIGIYLLIKNYINNKEAFKLIYITLFSYILINIGVLVVLPDGIFPEYGIYFLGIRTRFTEYSIALIYVALLYFNNFTNKKFGAKRMLTFSILLSVLNIIMQWIATGIIVIVMIGIIYMLLKKNKNLKLVYATGFIFLIIFSIDLVNGNLLNYFSGLFEFLNKDITLTGRTIIWNNAIEIVKKYFWLGYGYVNDGNIVRYGNGLWQAHNTMLQSICDSGIFGTSILYSIIYIQGIPLKNKLLNKDNALGVAIIFGFMIMMMSEIIYYYPIFIFTILLIGNSKKILEVNEYDKK